MFDLFAGSSTGGIIALGLVAPDKKNQSDEKDKPKFKAQEIADIYRSEAKKIFFQNKKGLFFDILRMIGLFFSAGFFLTTRLASDRWFGSRDLSRDLSNHPLFVGIGMFFIGMIGRLTMPRYDRSSLDQLLKDKFKIDENSNILLQDALKDVLITSWSESQYTKGKSGTHLFTKATDIDGIASYFWQAAAATSAAPTFFDQDENGYSDGGLLANNPTQLAVNYLLRSGVSLKDIIVVSIGTGKNPESAKSVTGRLASSIRLLTLSHLGWASLVVNLLTDSEKTHDQLSYLFKEYPGNYYRIQFNLKKELRLDDLTAVEQIEKLLGKSRRDGEDKDHYTEISNNKTYITVREMFRQRFPLSPNSSAAFSSSSTTSGLVGSLFMQTTQQKKREQSNPENVPTP